MASSSAATRGRIISQNTETASSASLTSQPPSATMAITSQPRATMVSMSSTLNNHHRPGQSNTKTTSITYTTPPKKQQQHHHPFRNSGNSATTAASSNSSNSLTVDGSNEFEQQQQQQEEGVLRDVLQELDKERTRRAELEAQIRQIQAEKLTLEQEMLVVQANANAAICTQSLQAAAVQEEQSEISRRAFFAMEAQVQGYQQIVDALTLGKPAIAHAAAEEKAALELSSSSSSASILGSKKQSPRRKNLLRQQAASKSASSSSTSTLGTHGTITVTPTLPLHVVRLLEVMPWDARAQVHIFGKEEMFEWQVWNEREQSWSSSSSNIKLFPRLFQTLPIATGTKAVASNNTTGTASSSSSIVKNNNNNNSIGRGGEQHQRNLLVFLAGAGEKPVHLPTKHGVLTNVGMNYILNIEAGYPLPQDGGVWEWVGGWRVEKRVTVKTTPDDDNNDPRLHTQKSGADGIMPVLSNHHHSNHDINTSNHSSSSSNGSNGSSSGKKVRNKVDCDENGWSYAVDANHFQTHPTELVWDNPGGNSHDATADSIVVERTIRRRKWSRQRVLVEYPHASEGTKQYLKLLAENARLAMTANKVSDQLVETKLSLTETEEKLENTRTEMAQQMALLHQEVREKTRLLQEAGVAVVPNTTTKAAFLSKSSSLSSSHSHNALQELLNKNEPGKQQLGSKFSQWIHGSSSRKNSDDGSTASNDSVEENPLQSGSAHSTASNNAATASAEGAFDWRKVGPSTLLDKFKPVASSNTTMSSSARRNFFQKGSLSSNLDDDDLTAAVSVNIQNNDNKKTVIETSS